MSVPIFQPVTVHYVPWVPPTDQSTYELHYKSLNITPLLKFDKTTLNALDEAYTRLDGQLHIKLKKIRAEIETIKATDDASTTLIIASTALALAGLNSIIAIVFSCCYYRLHKAKLKQIVLHPTPALPAPPAVTYKVDQDDVKLNIDNKLDSEHDKHDDDDSNAEQFCHDCHEPISQN